MELKGYDASGNLLWQEEVDQIVAVKLRNGVYYECRFKHTSKVATLPGDYLDRNHPGWRDLLVEADDD